MAVNRLIALSLLLTLVPASSLLGLTRPMTDDPVDGGWDVFGDVWQANFWGDAMFVVTTLAAAAATVFAMRWSLQRWASPAERALALLVVIGLGLLLHWTAYALSWSLTLHPYMDANVQSETESNFWGWDWDMMYSEPLLGLESAWTFTWCWGWAGLALSSVAGPLVAWLIRPSPAGTAKVSTRRAVATK